jgi:hypothetical protein
MAEHERGQLTTAERLQSQRRKSPSAEIAEAMRPFGDYITSPQTRLIIRNAVQTLLELGYRTPSPANVSRLLSDDDFRSHIISELTAKTPEVWSDEWKALWKKDADPLLSRAQEKVVTRASLIRFWSEEWERLSSEAKLSAVIAARRA